MFVAIAHAALERESPYYRLVAELDRDRRNVGLDHVLWPDQILGLERCARRWERIENALTAQLWQSQPELSARIDAKAFQCMLELVSFIGGEAGTLEAAKMAADRLREISRAMDAAASVLESYHRPGEVSAGVPAVGAFAEIDRLVGLL